MLDRLLEWIVEPKAPVWGSCEVSSHPGFAHNKGQYRCIIAGFSQWGTESITVPYPENSVCFAAQISNAQI